MCCGSSGTGLWNTVLEHCTKVPVPSEGTAVLNATVHDTKSDFKWNICIVYKHYLSGVHIQKCESLAMPM